MLPYHASQFSFQGPQVPESPASSPDVRFNQLVDQLSPPASAPEGDLGPVLAHMSAEYQARSASASPPSQKRYPPSPFPAPSKGQLTLPELWRAINQQFDNNGQAAATQAPSDSSKDACIPA